METQLEFSWHGTHVPPPMRPERSSVLSAEWDEASFHQELERQSGLRLRLTLTDNSSSMMMVRHDRTGQSAALRLHRMFLAASPGVVTALAAWVKHPRRRQDGTLGVFIRENRHRIAARAAQKVQIDTKGVHFDLRALFDEVNREHFGGTVTARITWGRMPRSGRRRRSIRFGSYTAEENLIRIHPLLDQEFVPRYFIRYIVYHEMLHAYLGVKTGASGRRQVHTREFKEREMAYPDYKRAQAWQDQPSHLRKLLH